MELHEVAAYLEKVGLQYMATIGLDGKPKVRPVHGGAWRAALVLHEQQEIDVREAFEKSVD